LDGARLTFNLPVGLYAPLEIDECAARGDQR
jgi:hypothetical protein